MTRPEAPGALCRGTLMRLSRRQFVRGCATAAAAQALWPGPAHARRGPAGTFRPRVRGPGVPEILAERVDPAVVRQLALSAVEAARAAGASYADVTLTRRVGTFTAGLGHSGIATPYGGFGSDEEQLTVRVRALVQGHWGAAGSPYWHAEEMPVLARKAVSLARATAEGPPRTVDWRPVPVAQGEWTVPVEIDPLAVPLEERIDFLQALDAYLQRVHLMGRSFALRSPGVLATRQERAVATTEGAYFAQTTYSTGGLSGVSMLREDNAQFTLPFRRLTPSGRGWELFRDAKLLEQLPGMLEEFNELAATPVVAAEPGRYDLVCDGWVTAELLQLTLGRATELDRAMGELANSVGTSYLGPDPLALLGTFQAGSPLLTLTADRALPGGVSTVRWDDEGVTPETTTLIKEGVLVDYQTTREQAGWLAPYYEKAGRPVRSHGHAGYRYAEPWIDQSMLPKASWRNGYYAAGSPNVVLRPGATPATLAELVAGTKRGLLLTYGLNASDVDYQCKTGTCRGVYSRVIRDGKLGPLTSPSVLFNAVDLWRRLRAVGGEAEQITIDGAQAVPTLFADVAVTR